MSLGHWEAFCLSSSIQVLPLDVTTPRDSHARNYRELATLLNLNESFAYGRFEPLNSPDTSFLLNFSPHCYPYWWARVTKISLFEFNPMQEQTELLFLQALLDLLA